MHLADLYASLINSSQRTLPAGELAPVRALVEQSDEEYAAADAAFEEGDRIMSAYIGNSAQYMRYYMQFLTPERLTMKVSDILYNHVADIVDLLDYSQRFGGSLDRHIVPMRWLLAEYVERIDRITPRSVNDPDIIVVARHIDNIVKLADLSYMMSQQQPSSEGGITAADVEAFGKMTAACDDYLSRGEVQSILRIMSEE